MEFAKALITLSFMAAISRQDPAKFILFSELYDRYSDVKRRRKAFLLIETAIQCFDKKGFEITTLKMIAREAAVTSPLFKHYFKDLNEIRETALKYIKVIAQKMVVDATQAAKTPQDILKAYLGAHFDWLIRHRSHVRVWHRFLSLSSVNRGDRSFNMMTVSTGEERILEMILKLAPKAQADAAEIAKLKNAASLIQVLLLGALVAALTDEEKNTPEFRASITESCLKLANEPFQSQGA